MNIDDLYNAMVMRSYSASVAVTRTNDVLDYAAGDCVGAAPGSSAALTFANIGPSGGGQIQIIGSTLRIDHTGIISGQTSYDLHLYNVTPPSAYGDNVPWDLLTGDRAAYLGKIALGTPADIGGTLWVESAELTKRVTLLSSSMFGYLVTLGAHVPVASIVHTTALFTKAV